MSLCHSANYWPISQQGQDPKVSVTLARSCHYPHRYQVWGDLPSRGSWAFGHLGEQVHQRSGSHHGERNFVIIELHHHGSKPLQIPPEVRRVEQDLLRQGGVLLRSVHPRGFPIRRVTFAIQTLWVGGSLSLPLQHLVEEGSRLDRAPRVIHRLQESRPEEGNWGGKIICPRDQSKVHLNFEVQVLQGRIHEGC